MPDKPEATQPLSISGEVVEILQKPGERTARIVVEPNNLLDIAANEWDDTHLGDRVVIDGHLTIARVSQNPDEHPVPESSDLPGETMPQCPTTKKEGEENER